MWPSIASTERFESVTTFTEWRRRYPGDVRYQMRRVTTRDDLAVVELSISYNGRPWQYGVQLLEFRGDKIARERTSIIKAWEASEWRAPGARTRPPTHRADWERQQTSASEVARLAVRIRLAAARCPAIGSSSCRRSRANTRIRS